MTMDFEQFAVAVREVNDCDRRTGMTDDEVNYLWNIWNDSLHQAYRTRYHGVDPAVITNGYVKLDVEGLFEGFLNAVEEGRVA